MTIAIYPGSFDPITNGHIDILKSGAEIFDKVIIAVSYNVNKKGFLPIEERIKLIILKKFTFLPIKINFCLQSSNLIRKIVARVMKIPFLHKT